MAYNVLGISEVPSIARNLDEAIAKSDMHLLGDVYDADNSEYNFHPLHLVIIPTSIFFTWSPITSIFIFWYYVSSTYY